MSEIAVHLDFESSADAVWKELADYGGIGAWAPGVVSCKLDGSGIGAVRSVEMPGGAVMEERLESFDDASRTLSYAIVGGPLPVNDYLATVKVSETDGGCRVDWGASFVAPEGVPADGVAGGISGAYTGMLAALKKHLGEEA
ncbi:MAG: SRPBCC family protein [Myxococcota bacterium]|jgi:hypothetical protein|nr:SRPBCC family protein [Myxococcota bacterium]